MKKLCVLQIGLEQFVPLNGVRGYYAIEAYASYIKETSRKSNSDMKTISKVFC